MLGPHCGEAGDVDHLVATYLVAHQINHGILLRKNARYTFFFVSVISSCPGIGSSSNHLSSKIQFRLIYLFIKMPLARHIDPLQFMNVSKLTLQYSILEFVQHFLTTTSTQSSVLVLSLSSGHCHVATEQQ